MVTPVPFAFRPPTPISTPRLRRVLVAQSDPAFAATLASALGDAGFGALSVATQAQALLALDTLSPDVVLLDLELPDGRGVASLDELFRARPSMAVVVVTAVTEEGRILESIRAGAVGYVFKEDVGHRTVPIVEEAMRGGTPMSRAVARLVLRTFRGGEPKPRGRAQLTPRERGVLDMLAQGKSYADVGATLGVSENTVRSHVRSIYDKLGASSKTEAVMAGLRMGLLRVD